MQHARPNVHFAKVQMVKRFSINRRTGPSNSQEFRPLILNQCGRVRLTAVGQPVGWASPWPPQGRADLAPSFAAEAQECGAHTQTLHPCQVSIRRQLHLPAGVHAASLLLQPSHTTSCHLQDDSSILPGVCLLLEQLWSQERLAHLSDAADLMSVQPFQQRLSELQEENKLTDQTIQDWARTKTTSHDSHVHLFLKLTCLLRVRSSWDAGIRGAMLDLFAAEASAETISSQLTMSLLFVVPHLHMNVWIWLPAHFLTLSANHRAGWKDKGKNQLTAALAWWTMGRDRWTTGIDGDRLTEVSPMV